MPFAAIPEAQPTTRRDRRVIVIVGVLMLAVFAAVGIWAAVRPGAYGASRNGCVTVTVPGPTGGSLLHGCGSRGRAICRTAYVDSGTAARLTRQQCRLAGITQRQAAGG